MCIILVGAGSGDFVIRAAKLTETTPYSLATDMQINYVADYFPYGKVLRIYVNGQEERYLTTQHERDKETGLDYRGARYYDTDVARFLSLDPLATKFPEWSPYNYVMGNPIMLIDPTGRAPETKFVDVKGTVIADIDDGSNQVYVVDLKNKGDLMRDLSDNFGNNFQILDPNENAKLGEKYGITLNEYKSRWDDMYSYSGQTYFEAGYEDAYNSDKSLSNDPWCIEELRVGDSKDFASAYDTGQIKGREAQKKGIMSEVDPKIKNNTPELRVTDTNNSVKIELFGREETMNEFNSYMNKIY